jgi:signal peptidase I
VRNVRLGGHRGRGVPGRPADQHVAIVEREGTDVKYVKRLVGLPGETIAIHRGKLYRLAPDKGLAWDDPAEGGGRSSKTFMHVNDPKAQKRWDRGEFEVLRKPPEALLALARLVHDNDHPGKGQPERWVGADGWRGEGRGFRHDGSDKTAWLRYRHTADRSHPERQALITDFLGYNTFVTGPHPSPPEENWASDLILECEASLPDKPTGELTLELSRGIDRFRARWDLSSADGHCTLYRVRGSKESKLAEAATGLKGKGTYKLRLANVDERLTVWVDGRLPFDAGLPYPPAETEGADPANDLEPASIGLGKGAAVKVDKLRLLRDTYFTANDARPNAADAPDVEFGDPHSWGPLGKLPVLTMYVQPGHYLCLGDNSPESADSRGAGAVPDRLLLGKAVFVYYPFRRAGPLR